MDEEVRDPGADQDQAMQSVTMFLDAERARQKSARRTWVGMFALVAEVGFLHAMTMAGVLPAEGRDLLAASGAVGLGLVSQL